MGQPSRLFGSQFLPQISVRADSTRLTAKSLWLVGWIAIAGACSPEKPPQPESQLTQPKSGGPGAAEPTVFAPSDSKYILSFAGKKGNFEDSSAVESVPDEAKGMVRVTLLGGAKPPAGQVWVANLNQPGDGGSFQLQTVPRNLFEELALGLGRKSEVKLPEGIVAPDVVPASEAVIVYKTDWCGVCKKLMGYLDRKGIQYIAKDIEKDQAAAGELQAKAKAKNIPMGSVPVIDVRGELMVGFDRGKLEELL